ncbi:hypothetical protein TNIN_164311 [Trichonephila inaurata madagascariensis]|uniref:Uncharacterized protein n=1 Tax=Trichonephila inaurata madagascariensis TaxID=2747483 RepID=A0A8X7C7J4_9ARAC|nr:hypothetical protein TNIN_164311 [Trichonephila inaurata madagascariensis]
MYMGRKTNHSSGLGDSRNRKLLSKIKNHCSSQQTCRMNFIECSGKMPNLMEREDLGQWVSLSLSVGLIQMLSQLTNEFNQQ